MRSFQVFRRSLQRRAFTLIEIIVVSTLIALLSGIALFSINEMYIRNIRKVSFAEAFQLATALSIAENDLDFYPKLNYLRQPKELILMEETTMNVFTHSLNPNRTVPSLDYWGHLRANSALTLRIISNWGGPYMGVSQARQDSNRGAQSGIVKMRLPYLAESLATINGAVTPNVSVVDWPADPFGNPYLLYQFKAVIDPTFAVNIPLFLEDPSDEASFRNMIVSYGRNNFPGGNENTSQGYGNNTLLPGALYVDSDVYDDLYPNDETADFTLKLIDMRTITGPARSAADEALDDAIMAAIETRDPRLLLSNDPNAVATQDTNSQHYLVLRSFSINTMDSGNFQVETGQVGVIDTGSDDIVLEF